MKELDRTGAYPIHRDPPKFEDLTTVQEVLYTGIKAVSYTHLDVYKRQALVNTDVPTAKGSSPKYAGKHQKNLGTRVG